MSKITFNLSKAVLLGVGSNLKFKIGRPYVNAWAPIQELTKPSSKASSCMG